jgi:membrane associated rhomboid family serine protease
MLIVANIAAFWYQVTHAGSWNESLHASVQAFGMTPVSVMSGGSAGMRGEIPAWATLLTSMFMHGGLLHLGSNMLYLWVFGRNVEDDFGHMRFLVFYVVTGLLAAFAFAAAFPSGTIPLVGASGAVAGILGAYFLRFPLSRIYTVVFFFIFIRVYAIHAFFILGLWFAIQIMSCMVACMTPEGAAGLGGVAWISHVAGFVVGLVWTIIELRRRYYLRLGRG